MMNRKWIAAIGAGLAAFGVWKTLRMRRRSNAYGKTSGLTQAGERDEVYEASVESFPASDPPSHTVTTGPTAR
jgi:hypothetical protein